MLCKIKDYVSKKHFYCICVIVALIMSFGFYASNYTLSTDMLVFDYYSGTVLISAGRFSAPIISFFTNWMQFAPFWHTVAMGIILFISGLAMALVFKELSDGKIADSSVFVFWAFFSTYPIIIYQLTYPILSVILPYFLISVAMWQLIPLIKDEKISFKNIILALCCLVVSVDMYESHATVFLAVFFGSALVRYIYASTEKTKKIMYFLKVVASACGLLMIAIIADFCVSKLVCYITCGTTEFWYAANTHMEWFEDSFINVIRWLYRELLAQYVITGVSNYSIWLFDVALFVGGIGSFVYSVKKRSLWCVFLYAATCISSLALGIVIGSAPEYRMAQAIPVIVALFMMLVAENLKEKKIIKKVAVGIFIILIFNQTLIINRYSVVNYQRHEYEQNIIVDISKDLKDYPISEKPVLFVYDDGVEPHWYESTPIALKNPIAEKYKEIMCRVYDAVIPATTFKRLDARYGNYKQWGGQLTNAAGVADFFNIYRDTQVYRLYNTRTVSEHYSAEIYVNFDINGCKLIVPELAKDKEKHDEIRKQYIDMVAYPYEGYIKECDDMIIVKIYKK